MKEPVLPKAFVLAFIALAGLAAPAAAATLRGEIAAVAGDALTVKTREGEVVPVHLGPKARLIAVVRASEADLKPNAFIEVAAVPEGDGLLALEVHVFPEAMRGTGEGFHAFDLAPGSSMTNGALAVRLAGVDGDRLTVSYNGGQQTIRLPKSTPIVTFADADRADMKAGAGVVVRADKAADGAYDAAAVLVGRDGVVPPM